MNIDEQINQIEKKADMEGHRNKQKIHKLSSDIDQAIEQIEGKTTTIKYQDKIPKYYSDDIYQLTVPYLRKEIRNLEHNPYTKNSTSSRGLGGRARPIGTVLTPL